MVEITASDIYWIGAMDKISLGLIFLACLSALLIICAIQIYSGAMALFGVLPPSYLFQVLRLWQQ